MKRHLLFLICSFLILSATKGQSRYDLGGTIVPVRCTQTVSSKNATTGQIIYFMTTTDIISNGVIVIPRGTRCIGKIFDVVKPKSMGKKGSLSIQLDHLQLTNGERIPLRATIYEFEGKNNSAAAYSTLIFYGAGALIKGGNAKLNSKTVINAEIAEYTYNSTILPQTTNNAPITTKGDLNNRVTRDNAGNTALERTIIRWYFDSDPKGAQVYWRVISGVPEEVKNTNENYIGTTPYEETRSFNILGLTYENSRNVQIEITIRKKGYIDQKKKFNVRQAIDQMEISSFYNLYEE
ncbi:MAG: hypothetical protein J5965_21300 [Aeriscardovia sp.]|nr:hypothetical protein [Aeriscardovia sp.]